jgi:hypothetical protein
MMICESHCASNNIGKEKEERRVAQEAASEVREKEKAEAAIQKAEWQAEKQRQQQERNAAKALKLSQKGKRRASQAVEPKKRQERGRTSVGNGSPLPPPVFPNQNHSALYCLCTQRSYSLYRLDPATKFLCSPCHNQKKAKLLTTRNDSWNTPCCNACYGRLLSTKP